jgi:hypothetical protein
MKLVLITTSLFIMHCNFAAPIAIVNNSALNFGSIVAGSATKIVPPGSSENASNASFRVTGDANTAYTISLPSTITLLKNGTGPESITVNALNSNPTVTGTIQSNGRQNLYVGGSLSVPMATNRGNYTGTFTVDVVY